MSEIKIYKDVVVKPIGEIKPYWRNPRKNDKTVEALCKVIPEVGFNVPLVIDEKGIIVKGHARYRSAVILGLKELPCIVTDQSEEKNRLDRLSDNKISELTEWDVPELRYELEQIDFPLEDVGFDVTKTEFMDNTYAQIEDTSVDEEALNQAKASIMSQIRNSSPIKTTEQDFEKTEDLPSDEEYSNVESGTKKMLKIRCPKCGEEILIPNVEAV
jgi:hypothetical protein